MIERFKTYMLECLRLLYWSYFKPFTLRRYLQDMPPNLEANTNPFWRLRRHADQGWWLALTVPWFIAIIFGLLSPLLLPQALQSVGGVPAFNWQNTMLFLAGWSLGLLIPRIAPGLGNVDAGIFLLIGLLIGMAALLYGALTRLAPDLTRSISQSIPEQVFDLIRALLSFGPLAFGVVFGVLFGFAFYLANVFAFGVVGGVAFGVAYGVFVGAANSVVGGVALGAALGVAFGASYRVTLRAYGMVIGVAAGALVDVAAGVAWVLGVLRVYFWLPELVWMMVLAALSQKKNAARALRLLPPRFDQAIYLPLPFMDEILVEAHRENPAAAQQFIRYLTSETNQQAVAARAMAGIGVDTLERCQSVQDIVQIADRLAWLPSPPPKQVSPLLAEFVDVSRSVRAATHATSPFRQSEGVARQMVVLRGIQDRLAISGDQGEAMAFGGVVNRWLPLLQALHQSLEAQAKESEEIPQVYVPGSALEPQLAGALFRGRDDLFRQIEDLVRVRQPQTLLLHGGRRAGKTSTLNYLPRRVSPDVLALKVDMQGVVTAMTLTGLATQFATYATESASRQNVILPRPEAQAFQADPIPALERWMDRVEFAIGPKRVLLCVDEYERLGEFVEAHNTRAPLNFLRYVIQNRRRWIVLLSGSHLLDELPAYWSDYLINTRPIRVSYLERDAAESLITHPIEDFPAIYAPETVAAILELTRCQPYLIQLACYELVDRLNRERRKLATPDDLQAVVPVMFQTGSEYFREFWESLSGNEQDMLRRVARVERVDGVADSALQALARREIIERVDGSYRFQVPLMHRYVESRLGMG